VASGGVCTAKVNVKSAVKKGTLLPILVAVIVFGACIITLPTAGAVSKYSFEGAQGDDSNEVQPSTQENVQENPQIHTYNLILIGYPTVTQVTVSLEQEMPNVNVLVEELDKPAGAVEPFLPVRAYISINVAEARVENAAIEFKVPKSWVEQNNIDERTIKLLRLNGEWRELPTKPTRSSDLYFYFEAQTPGFSIFAVVGEAKGPVAGPPLALYAAILMIAVAGGFSAVYWFLTRPMKSFISLKQLKRTMLREKTKGPEESELEIADVLKRLRSATKVKRVERPPSEEFKQEEPKLKRRHVSNEKDIERLRRLKRKMMGKS